ncbi:MAG: restriction endonuclease [Haloarculaceae archaeon]
MNRVVDLTAGDTDTVEVLELTGSGGVLGTRYLQDDPPATHIAEEETAKYVIRNKKAGVEVKEGTEDDLVSVSPDGNHQALMVATDVRLLFLVGSGDGDHVQSLPLGDVLTATAESGGLRTTDLRIDTQSAGVVTFPVRGELDAVAEYVDHAAQIWARAGRTADEVETGVRTANRRIAADQFEAALDAVAGVEAEFERALGDLRDLGQGALTAFIPTAESLVDDVNDVRRRAHAGRGGASHGRAHDAWQDREYVVAATAYEEALGGYDAAVHHPGSRPTEESLTRRVLGAAREREVLRSAPLTDVIAAKNRAAEVDDPATAAESWERALELARNVTGLDWPAADQDFHVDSEIMREHASECAERAIDHRERAGRQWMAAGDRIAAGDLTEEATQAYERAWIHFERTISLSRKIFPGRLDALEAAQEALDERLSGETVPGSGEELPQAAEAEDAETPAQEGEGASPETPGEAAAGAAGDGAEARLDQDAVSEKVEAARSSESTAAVDVSDPAGWGSPGRTPESNVSADSIEADGTRDPGAGDASEDRADVPPADGETTADGAGAGAGVAGGGEAGGAAGPGDGAGGEGAGDVAGTAGLGDDPAEAEIDEDAPEAATVLRRLRTLDAAAFEDLVADLWEARGWSTMSFAASGGSVYDIVAIRNEPAGERLLVWTAHQGDDGMISARNVERIAAAQKRSTGDERPALVTDARLPSRARSEAESAGIEVLDGSSLASALLETGLYRSLPAEEG